MANDNEISGAAGRVDDNSGSLAPEGNGVSSETSVSAQAAARSLGEVSTSSSSRAQKELDDHRRWGENPNWPYPRPRDQR